MAIRRTGIGRGIKLKTQPQHKRFGWGGYGPTGTRITYPGETSNYKPPALVTAQQAGGANVPGAPNPDPVSPYDALALAETGNIEKRYTTGKADIQAARAAARARAQTLLGRLPGEQSKAENVSRVGMNRAGLLFSGAQNQEFSDIITNYLQRKNDIDAGLAGEELGFGRQENELENVYGPQGSARIEALTRGADRKMAIDPAIPADTPAELPNPVAAASGAVNGAQAPAAARPTPKQGYKFVQDAGPRAGLSYNVVLKNGKRYRYYQNGDVVLA